ncbi:MAG: hypothetical protein IKT72_01900 [Clostridia bacterium]|nr:hypothetical protein [Clostridia bacterium]
MVYQDVELTDEEKKRDRQGKFLNFLGTLLFFVVFVAVFIGSLFLIVRIPTSNNPFLFILVVVAMFILGIDALLVSVLIGSFISSPIYKMAQEKLVIQKRNCFDKSIIFLREYYGWTEPCIVTKCYDSSDEKFKNRDVCIFLVDDELRITADLRHGFSIRENDLGCYSFKIDEFSLEQIQGEKFLITKVMSEDLVFDLGRRAKGFIEKRYISPKNDT